MSSNDNWAESKTCLAFYRGLAALQTVTRKYVDYNYINNSKQESAEAMLKEINPVIAKLTSPSSMWGDANCPDGYHFDPKTNQCVPD